MSHTPNNPQPADDQRVDAAVAAFRDTLGVAPEATTMAAEIEFAQQATARAERFRPARIIVGLTGLVGVLLDGAVLLGGLTHARQDVAALHLAISVGFLIAAWQPARYARALAPVAAVAAVALSLPALGGTTIADQGVIAELSHLPVLVGAAGLLLGRWPSGTSGVDLRRRATGRV